MNTHCALLPGSRDPERLLRETVDTWDRGDAWIFGYASLIWRPEFDSVEDRPATVYGWHRSLAMRSRVNRGTPECPGLVFALVPGGSCRGRAYRVERSRVEDELEPALGARDADRRLRPEVAALPHAAGRRPRPRLHPRPAQPQPHRPR